MYKILIVEDDLVIAQMLTEHLTRWGYSVEYVSDYAHVIEHFVRFQPQLVLMDITLPFYNGYHWCSEIRKLSSVPVVFLSSASDNMNIVMAMNMGADDFIAKPINADVVCAKIGAMLRRTYSYSSQNSLLEHHGAILNINEAALAYNGQKLDLTKNEFKILQMLMEYKGSAVTRENLMKRLWDSDCFVDENTLTVNITRLRHKLEEIGLSDWIKTKKGIGYLLED